MPEERTGLRAEERAIFEAESGHRWTDMFPEDADPAPAPLHPPTTRKSSDGI